MINFPGIQNEKTISPYCAPGVCVLVGGGGGGGGWGEGTKRKFGLRCATNARNPRPCLRQKLLISLPSLRQETLLSDPDLLCFAYRIK